MTLLSYLETNEGRIDFITELPFINHSDNTFTYLVGKNGVGKSRLLRNIIIRGVQENDFNKVVAISNTQHHKFPYHWDIPSIFETDKYELLALEANPDFKKFNYDQYDYKYSNNSSTFDTKKYSILDKKNFRLFCRENKISPNQNYRRPNNIFNNYHYLDDCLLKAKNLDDFMSKFSSIFNFFDMYNYIGINTEINFHPLAIDNIKKELTYPTSAFHLNDKENLLELLNSLKKFESITLNTLSRSNFEIFTTLLNLNIITIKSIKFQKNKNKKNILLNEFSSGEKSLMSIVLALLSNLEDNTLVCIDEPEINLHPEWQEKIIEVIESTIENYYGCHIFIATHSPQIISGIKQNNSFVVDLSNNNKIINTHELKQRSSDFQLTEIFDFPGNNNEYLLRKLLIIINKLNTDDDYKLDRSSLELINHLEKMINDNKIDETDKVFILFKLIKRF